MKNVKEVQESGTKIVARPQKVVQNRVKAKTFYPQLTPEQVKAQNLEITTIGDSVILDGASGLQDIFPKMIIDGEVPSIV